MTTLTAEPRPDSLVARLALADPGLTARLHRGLADAETRLRETAADVPNALVAERSRYLIEAGGKRLRPLLVLLAAEFGAGAEDGRTGQVLDAAAMVELIHVASLHHDDVMDGARSGTACRAPRPVGATGRRCCSATDCWSGRPARRGPRGRRDQDAGRRRRTSGPGPAAGVDRAGGGESPLTHHFAVIADKTASLISLALRLGAEVAGAPAPAVRALAEYGEQLGIVFQLSDDLLDFVADPAESGKDAGIDLAVGVRTLPVLLALSEDGPRAAELRRLLEGGPLADERNRRRAAELLRSSSAEARARELLHSCATDARDALSALPDLPARAALESLVGLVEHRTA